MTADIVILLQLSACFIGLFALAEVLYHVTKVQAEYTRKLVHVGTGILTLLFPIYLQHLWQVIVICMAFLVLLLLSLKFNLLKSINKVDRKTVGSLLYPVIVIIVYAFYQYQRQQPDGFNPYLYYYLPILLMAICDPIAALVGAQYAKGKNIEGKTLVGSGAFFISALITSVMIYYMFTITQQGMGLIVIHSTIIAATTMLAERYSNAGWDNFTIPLVVVGYLWLIESIA